ncbi:Alpha-fucosidase A [Paramyrothecium foliicola]|nr:Alpha-fucosidase A [Paramyrothecium foliicola]
MEARRAAHPGSVDLGLLRDVTLHPHMPSRGVQGRGQGVVHEPMTTMAKSVSIGLLALGLATLTEARTFWASEPATYGTRDDAEYILKTAYPMGNGRLGAMQFGPPGAEKYNLNVDSLWSGGPFENSSYTGGNPTSPISDALPGIREWIFENGTGNISALLGSGNNYGSFRTLGNLTVNIDHGSSYENYKRSLDLETGVHKTTYEVDGTNFTSSLFCSYPDQVCVYHVASSEPLPKVSIAFENQLVEDASLLNAACEEGYTRFTGLTQAGPPTGLKYEAVARLRVGIDSECSNGVLTVSGGRRSLTFVVGAGTDYDQKHGTAEFDYSFKGEDPSEEIERVTTAASAKCYSELLAKHVADHDELFGAFTLDLPDTLDSASKDTPTLIADYSVDGQGDPYLEALLFDYSRYLLIASSRENSLPANLQGVWAEGLWSAWSGDYHANINLQMNYWVADQTGLARTQPALWDYMEDTWVPRGSETAELIYNGTGWVVHNEMNVYGFTAMKEGESWANYPAANAWMMQHVWDNFEYTQDVEWLRKQGYPLLKGTASFWLSQLQADEFFNDGTLVVNPCSSPEHGPTSFGCTHYQQVIHQTFEATLAAAALVSEEDEAFIKHLTESLQALDTGLHISDWGGIKEWKLPDSYGYETQNRHRHLSHLVGWHPGYSISSFHGGYTNETIQSAVEKTLQARGEGNADDANAGWAKVWRSACWARLNNTERAHFQLRYAIDENFAGNGFSMYWALNQPFQIDANFGLGGAVLSMLVVDLPLPLGAKETRTVVLGPAIPAIWAGGSVKGLRLRGGNSVDFSWDDNGVVTKATLRGKGQPLKLVNKNNEVLAEA